MNALNPSAAGLRADRADTKRNVLSNDRDDLVSCRELAVRNELGRLSFTGGPGTVNRLPAADEPKTQKPHPAGSGDTFG